MNIVRKYSRYGKYAECATQSTIYHGINWQNRLLAFSIPLCQTHLDALEPHVMCLCVHVTFVNLALSAVYYTQSMSEIIEIVERTLAHCCSYQNRTNNTHLHVLYHIAFHMRTL